MSVAPLLLRRAVGLNASLVFRTRRDLLDRTIYNRPPASRPLSGRLRRSEKVEMAGDVARIRNTAPYAQIRNDMTGTSKQWGHDKTSDWAGRAVAETRAARLASVRAAMREIMAAKAS